jgi:hypothetical protein
MKIGKQNYFNAVKIIPILICGFATSSLAEANDAASAIAALKAEISMLPATDKVAIQELSSVISTLEKQAPKQTVINGNGAAYAANALPIHDLNGQMNEGNRPTPELFPQTRPAENTPGRYLGAGRFENKNDGVTENPAQPDGSASIRSQNPVTGPHVITWGGADFAAKSFYSYIGSIQALSGQNIESQDGFLIRESAGYGSYKFKKITVTGGEVSGNVKTADLMLGYKKAFDKGGVAVYAGGSVENHVLSSNDAGDSVNGTHAGFASSADAQFTPIDNVTLLGMGSYASANQSYWSHFALGYSLPGGGPLGSCKIGPTIGFSGGKDYSIRRYGAAITDINIGFANMYTYAGYGTYSNDTDSVYGGLGLGKSF